MMTELNLNNHSALYEIAEQVPENEDVSVLIQTMQQILAKTKGIGLAAPQIGVSKRVIIINTPGIHQIIINPVITRRRLGKTTSIEGCLSYPGLTKKMKRDKQIIVEGFNSIWEPVKFKLRGLESYCVQHEIDHLNGITIKNKRSFNE